MAEVICRGSRIKVTDPGLLDQEICEIDEIVDCEQRGIKVILHLVSDGTPLAAFLLTNDLGNATIEWADPFTAAVERTEAHWELIQ